MKHASLLLGLGPATAFTLRDGGSPVTKVVELIKDLQDKIEKDGENEQKSYDKYACWCENTLARKAADIEKGKTDIDKLQTLVNKLKGELGIHGAQIEQLKKDIEQNLQSQKEATSMREKQHKEYEEDKTEAEQCIGALEAAIGVLTGAGGKKAESGGKGKFLETLEEAQLISVAGDVRQVLNNPKAKTSISAADLEVVKRFVEEPENFISKHLGGLSLAQVLQNPFGDYAPQSGAIQGILKGMYDSFTGDLEKDNSEEANHQKSFEELMETKKKEEETLKTTLEKTELDEAEKTKLLADTETNRDEAKEQLEADEEFFAKSKDSCKEKGRQWAERSRLRTEELQGITRGIEILTSDEAKETFKSSSETMFLQLTSSGSNVLASYSHKHRSKAYSKLKNLATRFHSVELAELAAEVKLGGHFDKIIPMVENMMLLLKREEADDIEHRDLCNNKARDNKETMADLNFDIEKVTKKLKRMDDDKKEMESKIEELKDAIKASNETLNEGNEDRLEELEAFKEAHKDDLNAIKLLDKAIVTLSEFYKNNKIPLELVQAKKQKKGDPDDAPEVAFQSGDYGGRKDESGGIIAILTMIKEDTENEVKDAMKADGAASLNYASDRESLKKVMEAQQTSKYETEREVAELEWDVEDKKDFKDGKEKDLKAEEKVEKAIKADCSWILEDFDKRRTDRKLEMEGLVEAKNYLMGVNAADEADVM